ncbi:NTP transferase domain-containing protein [bacterium]|nr:NTP transferase domain-containing protein [bacterium]
MTAQRNARRVAVIMAGGSGERFWPLSRSKRPKQLLCLTHQDQSLLQESISRIEPLVGAKNVFIATTDAILKVIREADARVLNEHVFAEPAKRNTAGGIIWATASLMAQAKEGEEVILALLPADHLVRNPDGFRETVRKAMDAAEHEDALVTLGIKPTRPDTGYGYIEVEEGTAAGIEGVHRVHRFREKPNRAVAREFLATGRFLWNSGMFFWRASYFLKELAEARPEMALATRRIAGALRDGRADEACRVFEELESISIDYALLERARNVLVVDAEFEWDDVGSWDALERTCQPDGEDNVALGNPVLIDTQNCIVYNEPGADKKAVAIVGAEDLVIVIADDSVLVVHKDRVQDVKQVVRMLKERGAKQV